MMVYGNREDGCKDPTGILSAVFCLLLLLSFLSACGKGEKNSAAEKASDTVKVDTTALLVRQISNCVRLYTTEYQYHKIVTYSDEPRITGNLGSANFSIPTRLGERKIAIPIDVSVKAYIDFASFSQANIERSDSGIVIVLPDPQIVVTASKIDHAAVRQYIDPLRSRFSDQEMMSFARQGEDSIVRHMDKAAILASAQTGAARILLPMLHRMGYTEHKATISFRHDLTPESLQKNITIQRLQ
ncbi:DUF4230 domain-containing protein [Alloprevotella rava]|nr:DUF4230 domain-containing protein [Alloprevotella rava]